MDTENNTIPPREWDDEEIALLIDSCISVQDGKKTRTDAVRALSKFLRKRAEDKGYVINDSYRNESGISSQMYQMEYLVHDTSTPYSNPSKDFKRMFQLYKDSPNEYEEILKRAKKTNITLDFTTLYEDIKNLISKYHVDSVNYEILKSLLSKQEVNHNSIAAKFGTSVHSIQSKEKRILFQVGRILGMYERSFEEILGEYDSISGIDIIEDLFPIWEYINLISKATFYNNSLDYTNNHLSFFIDSQKMQILKNNEDGTIIMKEEKNTNQPFLNYSEQDTESEHDTEEQNVAENQKVEDNPQTKSTDSSKDDVCKQIEQARKRLLDLSMRNSLLNFRHSDRNCNQIRVVDCDINLLFADLLNEKQLQLAYLPPLPNEPADEQTKKFQDAVELAMVSDEKYLQTRANLEKEGTLTTDAEEQLIRELKNRIREKLNLPPYNEAKEISRSEWARRNGVDPDYENHFIADEQQKQKKLKTILYPKEFMAKITGLRRLIKSDKEEKGTNTFYVALGFLEWREAESSKILHYAPLLLLRLTEPTKDKKGNILIESSGDPIQINISLREKLKDFHIDLPTFDEEDNPDSYFEKVKRSIKDQPLWKIRKYVTIGRFIFSRLAMYEDLDLKNWPNLMKSIGEGKLLSTIFKGSSHLELESIYDIDKDERIKKNAPILISSADSSQHSAIADAIAGENLVIKGPPGTGKSQTITNLIANALNAGKKVLFISEKKAALDVVYNRLKSAKLGDFCLELHSDKAKISNIRFELESAFQRYRRSQVSQDPLLETNERRAFLKAIETKKDLRDYYDELQKKVGLVQEPLFDVIWKAKTLFHNIADLPHTYQRTLIPNVEGMDQNKYKDIINELDSLENLYNDYKKATSLYRNWDKLNLTKISSKKIESIIQEIVETNENIEKLLQSIETTNRKFDVYLKNDLSSLNFAKTIFEEAIEIVNTKKINNEILPNLVSNKSVQELKEFCTLVSDYLKKYQEIEEIYNDVQKAVDTHEDRLPILNWLENSFEQSPTTAKLIVETGKKLNKELDFWKKDFETLETSAKIIFQKDHFNVSELLEAKFMLTELTKRKANFVKFLNNEDIYLEENFDVLSEIAAKIKKYKNLNEELSDKFDLEIIEDSDAKLKGILQQISQSNLFSIFKKEYREATSYYNFIAKNKKDTKEGKISNLKKLISLFAQNKHFIENSQYKEVLGEYYQGFETSIDDLLEINDLFRGISVFSKKHKSGLLNLFKNICLENKETARELYSLSKQLGTEADEVEFYYTDEENYPWVEYYKNIQNLSESISKFEEFSVNNLNSDENSLFDLQNIEKTIFNLKQDKKKLDIQNSSIKELIGDLANSESSKLEKIEPTLEFASLFTTNEIVKNISDFFNSDYKKQLKELQIETKSLLGKTNQIISSSDEIISSLGTTHSDFYEDNDVIDFDVLLSKMKQLAESRNALYNTWSYQTTLSKSKNKDYYCVIDYFVENNLPLENLSVKFASLFYKDLSELYADKTWDEFMPNQLSNLSADVRKLDEEMLKDSQDYLFSKLSRNIVPNGNNSARVSEKTELQLILHQISGHARQIPLRSFLTRAGKAVQALKPCFLMSPLSLAQYIAPNSLLFDILIIDEASQMYFDEALGGILRAKQLIVVGDEKQLPPTPFFQKSFEQELDDSFEDDEDAYGVQSILEKCLTMGFNYKELLWHYRSKSPSLINFSNKYFYNDKLKLFPSSKVTSKVEGIQYVYVGGIYKARQNEAEADAIVREVKKFVRNYPNKSLGIATMNTSQKALLEQKFDQLEEADSDFAKYKEDWDKRLESFFIKNLENVQGDERDFIFISTVYGPEEPGARVLQRFGPINGKNGHRRLNVLFTRAKYGLKLFTSMRSDDIIVNEKSTEGLRTLKNYLNYAQTGRLEAGLNTGRPVDSYFEKMVKDVIEAKGYEVIPQVGVKGFFIDLAVKHPKNKDFFALGIECDGAPYHSTKSARDRDCIRQEILEKLNWKIYRIWSKDWFFNTDEEIRRLLNTLEDVCSIDPEDEYNRTHLASDTTEQTLEDKIESQNVSDSKEEEIPLFTLPEPVHHKKEIIVELGDTVTYKRNDNGEEKTVTIISGPSNITNNEINQNTAIAIGLLGYPEGEETEVNDFSITILKIKKTKK